MGEERDSATDQRSNTVAKPRKALMLATSVMVVRKMLDAVAGSAPSFLSVIGIERARDPGDGAGERHRHHHDQAQLDRIGIALRARHDDHADARRPLPTTAPFRNPRRVSLKTARRNMPGPSSPSVMPRRVTARAWHPVLPD